MTSRKTELYLLAICVLAICIALFADIDTGANWFFWGPFFDAGHYPLFFICTIIGLRISTFLPKTTPRWLRQPYLPLTVFVILVEFIQPFFERSASIVDVQNGLLGIAAAGMVSQNFKRARSNLMRFLILACAGALIIPLLWPTRGSFHAIQWRKNNFPVLAKFIDPQEAMLWGELEPKSAQFKKFSSIRFVRSSSLVGNHGLLVSTDTGHYAGVGYSAGDIDWSNYGELELLVVNPKNDPFELYLRIDDDNRRSNQHSGRFNRRIILSPGTNKISIPIS